MNLIDLTPQQLKRAASIREQIDGLNKELRQLRRLDQQRNYFHEETHYERGWKKENCGGAAREMGEA
jgi:hypothetical protein